MGKGLRFVASSLIATTVFSSLFVQSVFAETNVTNNTNVTDATSTASTASEQTNTTVATKYTYKASPFNATYDYIDVVDNNMFYTTDVMDTSDFRTLITAFNTDGKQLSKPIDGQVNNYVDGYLEIMYYEDDTYKRIFVNADGNTSPVFEYISGAGEGLVAAAEHDDGDMGYVDYDGNVVVPYKYISTEAFSDGMGRVRALVKIDGKEDYKYGYIDKTGKVIVPIQYDWGTSFSNGTAFVQKDLKYALVGKDGNLLTGFVYDDFEGVFDDSKNDRILVKRDGKYGFINYKGEEVIPLIYDDAKDFGNYRGMSRDNVGVDENLALVSKNGRYFFIDMNGVEQPFTSLVINNQSGYYRYYDATGEYTNKLNIDAMYTFSEGLAPVSKNNKFGVVDRTGKFIVPIQYDQTGYCSEGYITIKQNEKWGFIDAKGKVLVAPKYDKVEPFYGGFASVCLGDKWGLIDTTGKLVVDIKYDEITRFENGIAYAKQGGKWGRIDSDAVVADLIYDDVYIDDNGEETELIPIKKNGKWGIIDNNENVIVPFEYDEVDHFANNMLIAKKGNQPYVVKIDEVK